jgi:hypothetical protein
LPQEYVLRTLIDQFTEIPLQLEVPGERLGWTRNWSSWRGFNLMNFPLFHVQTMEQERLVKTSFLAVDTPVKASSIEGALIETYEKVTTKLNLLSFLTNTGFVIISVNPPPIFRQEKRGAKLLDRLYWKNRKEVQYVADSEGHTSGQIFPGARKLVVVDAKGYQHNEYEIVADMREHLVKRGFQPMPIDEVERRWVTLSEAYGKIGGEEKRVILRALDLYRASRTNRDVFSRYVILWAALDSTTPYLEEMGVRKTAGMASHFGDISGLKNVGEIIHELYQTRTDIVHSKQTNESFPEVCKRRLFMLEWVFLCSLYKRLGLPQLPKSLAPARM